jgi:hypothetical protein
MNGGIVEYLLRGPAIRGRLEPGVDEATISLTVFRTTAAPPSNSNHDYVHDCLS